MNKLSSEFIDAYLLEIGVYTPVIFSKTPVEIPIKTINYKKAKPVIATIKPITPVVEKSILPEPIPAPPFIPAAPPVVVRQGMALADIQQQVSGCTACELSKHRKHTVFGNGKIEAGLVFIGEAPSADDDREGQTFVGKSGLLLNRMVAAMGMQREQVYTMNAVKCRPPWNRGASKEELAACRVYFDAQLQALQPKVICLLGRTVAQHVLNNHESLSTLREHVYDYQAIPVYVTYHPAYLLRNPARKQQAWQDLNKLMLRMETE